MFYCDECREKKGWPESLAMSIGQCEVCGQMRSCWDVKSDHLPLPAELKDDSKHTGIDCPVCGREFFVGDIVIARNMKKISNYEDLLVACKLAESYIETKCSLEDCTVCHKIRADRKRVRDVIANAEKD